MSDITTHGDSAITRVTSKGYSKENTFAGVLSFLRRRYSKDLAGADVVVSGIPLDLATTNRPGTRLGPAGIRAASVDLNWPIYPWGFGPCDRLSVIDYGDCWFDPHRPDMVFDSIVQHARTILASGAKMLTLGGDHYVTYPLLHAHAEKFGQPLSVIHFDAHSDTWADDDERSLNHGTMFYKAVRQRLIDPKTSVQIGIRTWNEDFSVSTCLVPIGCMKMAPQPQPPRRSRSSGNGLFTSLLTSTVWTRRLPQAPAHRSRAA